VLLPLAFFAGQGQHSLTAALRPSNASDSTQSHAGSRAAAAKVS
jgi:hypothetical protein